MTDLELATTDELVRELANRHTFSGIVIRSEYRGKTEAPDTKYKVTYVNLTRPEASELLGFMSRHMEAVEENGQ